MLATLLLAAAAGAASGCVKNDPPIIPPEGADASIPPLPSASTTNLPPPVVDAAPTPTLDAGFDGAAFASGLGAGAVVTKSSKFTLITKTGGSPGGHGIAASPAHTVVSGAAAGAKK